jgi:hypothetical protein
MCTEEGNRERDEDIKLEPNDIGETSISRHARSSEEGGREDTMPSQAEVGAQPPPKASAAKRTGFGRNNIEVHQGLQSSQSIPRKAASMYS